MQDSKFRERVEVFCMAEQIIFETWFSPNEIRKI